MLRSFATVASSVVAADQGDTPPDPLEPAGGELDVMEEEKLCERALAIGEHMQRRLRELAVRHKFIGDVIHGSVANTVRHDTSIPVLLVRAPGQGKRPSAT